MAQNHTTRISLEEFARDVSGVVRRVNRTGERVDVVWDAGVVTLQRSSGVREPIRLNHQASDRARTVHDVADLNPPSPELIAERQAVLARARQLRADIAGTSPTSVYDAVADIHADRAARERQLDGRP